MPKIKGAMRERLDSLSAALVRFIRNPNPFDDPYGCTVSVALIALAAVVILGGMYITGVIDFDFTKSPEERSASSAGDTGNTGAEDGAAVQEVGPPFLDGRHYAIFGTGDNGESRVYTFELIGDGDSGTIRVWEDETGQGTFEIVDGGIRIEMQRMVPPDRHEILEPNVFEGAMSADESGFSGTWTREGWSGVPGEMVLDGEFESISFSGRRL